MNKKISKSQISEAVSGDKLNENCCPHLKITGGTDQLNPDQLIQSMLH